MNKKLVVALGGNALGNTPEEQVKLVKQTAKIIVDLAEEGNDIAIGHGNGPQVGMINLAMECYAENESSSIMPFPECGAMSQGYIGYHLQQAIQNEFNKRNIKKNAVSLITQVIVDRNDPAFADPTKPIGSFYTKEDAKILMAKKGYIFKEDAGRGYRRVVPSPDPQSIVELDFVRRILNRDSIVITVGGGGVPVIKETDGLSGVDCVIDKDKSCAKLAADLDADMLIILTSVEKVYINYRKPNQQELSEVTVSELENYIEEGHFAAGSMLPKAEACINFLKGKPDGLALITSLEKAKDALMGKSGTRIKA